MNQNEGTDVSDLESVQSTPLISRWMRCFLALIVGSAIGLAPYLGECEIPIFDSLLKLFPKSVIDDGLLILSAVFIGLVGVTVQFYDYKKIESKWLKNPLKWVLLFAGLSFIPLVVVHSLIVVEVPYLGGTKSETFLVGFNKPGKIPCAPDMSKTVCVKEITLDQAAINEYWGDAQMLAAKLALFFVYLVFTGSFGLVVGLLLLIIPKFNAENASLDSANDMPDFADKISDLDGVQLEKLNKALASAFTKSSLTQMLEFDFGVNLETIALGDDLREVIFKVTKWAQSEGKLREMVEAAHRRNPGNEIIRQLAEEMRQQNKSISKSPF